MQEIREYIKEHNLLFDGGFGTYYTQRFQTDIQNCEKENLIHPQQVKSVHSAYIEAGARAIKTNTFHCFDQDRQMQEQVIRRAYAIAKEAVEESGEDVYIFADFGPAQGETNEQCETYFTSAIDVFLEEGATNFLFETQSANNGLLPAIAYLKERQPNAFVLVSFGVMPDGYSAEGCYYQSLMHEFLESGLVDYIGLNCVSSPKHLGILVERLSVEERRRMSLMPNAGYPVVRGFRTFFDGSVDYYAKQMRILAEKGIPILGGCCGTTPKHIAGVARELAQMEQYTIADELEANQKQQVRTRVEVAPDNRLLAKLKSGKKVIAVEFDSPKNADVSKFMEAAAQLQQSGIDAMTIADCPIAVARMDSTLLACKVKRELDLDIIPHMTCRDRNTNATKALLLGAHAEGVRNVLFITGDPIPTAQRDEVKQVYQFNSRKMMGYVNSLNDELFAEAPMAMFGALNVNAVNFDVELKRAQQKMQEGCIGFLTQPVMTEESMENIRLARKTLEGAYILGGIIPVVSERNARFMNEEINGITIPQEMIDAYVGADRKEGERLGITFSCRIAEKIAPFVDGFYFMTPFGRVSLISQIIQTILLKNCD